MMDSPKVVLCRGALRESGFETFSEVPGTGMALDQQHWQEFTNAASVRTRAGAVVMLLPVTRKGGRGAIVPRALLEGLVRLPRVDDRQGDRMGLVIISVPNPDENKSKQYPGTVVFGTAKTVRNCVVCMRGCLGTRLERLI